MSSQTYGLEALPQWGDNEQGNQNPVGGSSCPFGPWLPASRGGVTLHGHRHGVTDHKVLPHKGKVDDTITLNLKNHELKKLLYTETLYTARKP